MHQSIKSPQKPQLNQQTITMISTIIMFKIMIMKTIVMFKIVMFKIIMMTTMIMFKILPKIRLEDRLPVYPAEFIGAGNYEEELVLLSFTNPCITSISRDFPTLNKILLLLAFLPPSGGVADRLPTDAGSSSRAWLRGPRVGEVAPGILQPGILAQS